MENKRNYYRLLHVQFDAPAPVIKASYRTMMQKMRLHPDLGGDEGNAQLLNLALATLLDPKKRATYDNWLLLNQPESLTPNTKNSDAKSNATTPQSPSSDTPTSDQHSNIEYVHCAFCQTKNHRSSQLNKNWESSRGDKCNRCSAPLTEVANIEASMSDELRRMQRNVLSRRCEVLLDADSEKYITAQVVDFSLLGLSLAHEGKLAVGQIVLIRSESFSCVAETRYSHGATAGASEEGVSGLEFLTLEIKLSKGELLNKRY